MIEDLSRLLKHTGLVGIGSLLSRAIGFFMIPIYTRYLSPPDYGLLELLDLVVYFIINIVEMGIYGSVFRFYTTYESEEDKKKVISTALLYTSFTSVVCALGLAWFSPLIARVVLGNSDYAPFVRLVALILLFSSLTEVPLAYWRAQGRTTLFVLVSLGRALLGASTLAFFLIVLRWKVKGALCASLLANLLAGSSLFAIVLFQVGWSIDRKKLKEMLAYGVPLIPWGINGFVLMFSDRFFLRQFGNLAEVGVYALGYKLSMILDLIITSPFDTVWQWQQFELAKRENAKQIYATVETYLLLVTVLIGLGLAVMAKDVLRVFTPASYWTAARIVPLIILSYVFNAVRVVVVSGIYIKGATRDLAIIAVIGTVSNLLFNFLLIPRFLAMGAAVAALISYALDFFMCLYAAQRVYFVRYPYARNLAALVSAAVLYLVSTWPNLGLAGSVMADLLLVSAFGVVSLMLLGREQRSMFRQVGTMIARPFRRAIIPVE